MAKVSIVIPVYNVEKYLRECLESVKNQTLKDIEIICVDDGSTDRSGEILDEYAKQDNRFHIIHKQNEGYGKAMNVGMAAASAPYTGIVESDDRIEADMYEKLSAIMEQTKADVIKADYYQFYQSNTGKRIEEYRPLTWDEKYEKLYGQVFCLKEHEEALTFTKYTWSGLYRTEFLRREHILHNETPGASYQDNGFWFQTFVKAERIYFVKQAFYHYRIDNPNASMYSTNKIYAVSNEYDFVDRILEEMGEDGKPFRRWSRYIRIRDNVDMISRAAEEKQLLLAERVREELICGLKEGLVDAALFSKQHKAMLFDVLADPQAYVARIREERKRIADATSGYDAILVYGAGKIGRWTQDMLRNGRINTKIQAFAVTSSEGNAQELLGVPIRQIDDLPEYKEDALVIISVGKAAAPAVEEKLKELGFRHYIRAAELMG